MAHLYLQGSRRFKKVPKRWGCHRSDLKDKQESDGQRRNGVGVGKQGVRGQV